MQGDGSPEFIFEHTEFISSNTHSFIQLYSTKTGGYKVSNVHFLTLVRPEGREPELGLPQVSTYRSFSKIS